MNTKNITIIVVIVVLVIGGAIFASSRRDSAQSAQEAEQATTDALYNTKDKETVDSGSIKPAGDQAGQQIENSQAQPPEQTLTDKKEAMDKTTEEHDGCTRTVDKSVWTKDISLANRTVTFSVKGYGDIVLTFYEKDAPKAVSNFLRLASSGYYDCLTFHRVIKGFMIQGGDPNGNGTGGESAFGAKFEDELDPNTPSAKAGYVKGVLAMANAGPNTNGSQFFIMHADYPLPHNYTIFGKVMKGQDVIDKIANVKTGGMEGSTPVTPVMIEKVTVK